MYIYIYIFIYIYIYTWPCAIFPLLNKVNRVTKGYAGIRRCSRIPFL